jgi:hypothetical protein
MLTETRYAKSGDVNIAYQLLGKGPPDQAGALQNDRFRRWFQGVNATPTACQ